jgi:archaemetzincin
MPSVRALVAIVVCLVASHANAAPGFQRPSENERLGAIGNVYEEPEIVRELFRPDADFPPIATPRRGDWLMFHREPGQTFDEYRASDPHRVDEKRTIIYLQPLGEFPADDAPSLALLRDYAAAFFQAEVKILPAYYPHDLEFDPRENEFTHKRQRLTRAILGWLPSRLPADALCLLAVTMDDLYPDKEWNYVFGQASLEDRVGVYSFARYGPAFFDEKRGPEWHDIALRRACKILAHETAHMFGLWHCIYFDCVLNGANSLGESDAQPLHACPVCLRKLRHALRFNPAHRYEQLREFYRAQKWFEDGDWVSRQLKRVDTGAAARQD